MILPKIIQREVHYLDKTPVRAPKKETVEAGVSMRARLCVMYPKLVKHPHSTACTNAHRSKPTHTLNTL